MAIPLADEILVTILARRNAFFTPCRPATHPSTWWPAVLEEQAEILERGVAITGPAGDQAAGKRWQRAVARLERDGLIVRGDKSTRGVRARLTPAGEAHAAGLSAEQLVMYDPPWQLLEKTAELADAGVTNSGCVPEWALLDRDGYGGIESSQLVRLELDMLPLLANNLVHSHCDNAGRMGYGITDAGRALLKSGRPEEPQGGPYMVQQLSDHYDEEYARVLASRETLVGDSRHCVIPLSAGLWPAPPKRKAAK